jgi:large subunit ribosomal protein L24
MAARNAPTRGTKVPEIKKGDTVVVLTGKDAGKRGTVDRIIREAGAPSAVRSVFRRGSGAAGVKVVVEGLNISKRHTKPRPPSAGSMTTGRVPASQHGGILDIAQPLPIGRVMLVCPNCDRPTRIAHAILENGRRVRVCRHCNEQLEVKA